MGKLLMCRVCLVENVPMYVVVNKSLQKLYEKLTNVPFVTEDSRPMLTCTFCCTKLKQCWQFQRKCLEAEELFAQMLNEDYEPDPLSTAGQLQFLSGFIRTPIQNIDIVDVVQIDNVVKQDLPAEFERPDDVVEMKEELLRIDRKQKNLDDNCSYVEDVPEHHPESDSQDDVPLNVVKIGMADEHEVPQRKRKTNITEFTMTNRPNPAQIECLVEFLEQNPGIAKGLLRTTHGKLETKRKWINLATTLNSLGGVNKNGQGWAKYWAEKKCALKKQYAQLSASMRRTGGGTVDNLRTLSALDNRLVAVMGGEECSTGDSRTVKPFPQSNRDPESDKAAKDLTILPDALEKRNASPIPAASNNDAIPASSKIPAPPSPVHKTIPPLPRRRRRSLIPRPLENNMEQFARIEERRVEAEIITAQAFSQLSQHIGNIANALMSVANAISDIARKMPDP